MMVVGISEEWRMKLADCSFPLINYHAFSLLLKRNEVGGPKICSNHSFMSVERPLESRKRDFKASSSSHMKLA